MLRYYCSLSPNLHANVSETTIEITVNGVVRQVGAGTTLASLVGQLNLVPQQVAIEVNRRLVPRSEHPRCRLRCGDELEIVSLAGGG